MKLYSRLVLAILVIVVSLTVWALSQPTGKKEERKVQISQKIERNEFEKDFNRIESLSASRNFQELLQLSKDLKDKWGIDIKAYSILQAEISKSFASYDFQDKKQYFYAVELAKDVLKNSDQIPIELEYEMVSKLQSRSAYLWGLSAEESWERDRRGRVNQLLHLWNRLEKNIDRNFDFNDIKNRPIGNVPVPAPNYMPGITPDSIKDPEIRSKYEKAIEVNKQKAFKYNEQITLHKINKKIDEFVENFLINLYSEPPFNIAELSKFLKSFKIDREMEERILKVVMKAKIQFNR